MTARQQEAEAFQDNYEKRVHMAASRITELTDGKFFEFGVVLGSGLGDLADSIENAQVIPYNRLPFFPQTTVQGHKGNLVIGELEGVPIIGLQGRKHFYEVADEPMNTGMLQTIFAVHVLAELNVPNYFVTNAAGGLNLEYDIGDIMVLKSHIHAQPNPLLGRQHNFTRVDDGEPIWRFQPMNGAYDPELTRILKEAGSEFAVHLHQGTYIAVTGPTYETEGECIAFRDGFKADAVGMSTTAEVIVARNRGMRAVGFSCITNKIAQDGTNATNHDEVKAILDSDEVKGRLERTVRQFFALYRESKS
ncbi:MAG: purine-nucleoside phosphorylase [Nanoarchaeota archaeon]|nr:purine-nucleoside phosphorylase [Nanoarchaeota archaeon]